MTDLEKLQALAKKQAKDKARIEGRIESCLEELKEEGFNSEKEAKKAMAGIKKKLTKMKQTLESKTELFKEKYAEDLAKIS